MGSESIGEYDQIAVDNYYDIDCLVIAHCLVQTVWSNYWSFAVTKPNDPHAHSLLFQL